MYLYNWVFCIQINKTIAMSQVNRSVNKINGSLFLAYISNFSPPFFCPLVVPVTYYHCKENTYLCYWLLNDRLEGTWETKGKRNPWKHLSRWGFIFHYVHLKKLKKREKCFCFIRSNADIFSTSTPRKAQVNQVTAMGMVSAGHLQWWGRVGVVSNCCQNKPN